MSLKPGIYEALLDQKLRVSIDATPELRAVFEKLDIEEEPARLSSFLGRVIEEAFRLEKDTASRFNLANQIVSLLAKVPHLQHLQEKRLIASERPMLCEITPAHYAEGGMLRPETSLVESSLFTGSPTDPHLVQELQKEMRSADSVDMLMSFIKWSGCRLLLPAFEELTQRGGKLRIITTTYMGASDPFAIERLAVLPNTEIKISYDSSHTRLHAKAYLFKRLSGFSTAYIGSSNMSHSAVTSGLEWNLKVTSQDLPHILQKFSAEFETYWNSSTFEAFDLNRPGDLREGIKRARTSTGLATVLFDIKPHVFQERILDSLNNERVMHGSYRNLIVAATGTGKTVVSAFDFKRFYDQRQGIARLLYIAHRQEILEQAISTYRAVLRKPDFGELLVGSHEPTRNDHLFCSIGMLQSRELWDHVGKDFFDYIVIDEVHHAPADSYRSIFEHFSPKILLGLTATPERMDGQSVLPDFNDRFAAEIRLPEALDEKLLCPFHYFGIADPISLADDRYWRNGKYDAQALGDAYVNDRELAVQRVNRIASALFQYEPDLENVRGIGFCVSVDHAKFMAQQFNERNIVSEAYLGETDGATAEQRLRDFRGGRIKILFTCDKLNEGLDVPEINTVLFLRPTESLTVFLQQLGRGLRHAEGKEGLTVLDFVGQAHRKYRIDRKMKALLLKQRFSIDREVEADFPHLPPGCFIQLDKLAKEYVLKNIRDNLQNLRDQVVDRLESFSGDARQALTFGNFIRYHDYSPEALLQKGTWSEWRGWARLGKIPNDPDLSKLRKGLLRVAQATGPKELAHIRDITHCLESKGVDAALSVSGDKAERYHYRIWGGTGSQLQMGSVRESFERLSHNGTMLSDLKEVLSWASEETRVGGEVSDAFLRDYFELHAAYGYDDIKVALGRASFERAGEQGVGILHCPDLKVYACLVTFQKTEREFSQSTMYADYPISRELLHWESQSTTTQLGGTGQNLIQHKEKGYRILFFVRDVKRKENVPVPFTYLGPVSLVSYQQERPIQMVWRLQHPMPAEIYEENRRGA